METSAARCHHKMSTLRGGFGVCCLTEVRGPGHPWTQKIRLILVIQTLPVNAKGICCSNPVWKVNQRKTGLFLWPVVSITCQRPEVHTDVALKYSRSDAGNRTSRCSVRQPWLQNLLSELLKLSCGSKLERCSWGPALPAAPALGSTFWTFWMDFCPCL